LREGGGEPPKSLLAREGGGSSSPFGIGKTQNLKLEEVPCARSFFGGGFGEKDNAKGGKDPLASRREIGKE